MSRRYVFLSTSFHQNCLDLDHTLRSLSFISVSPNVQAAPKVRSYSLISLLGWRTVATMSFSECLGIWLNKECDNNPLIVVTHAAPTLSKFLPAGWNRGWGYWGGTGPGGMLAWSSPNFWNIIFSFTSPSESSSIKDSFKCRMKAILSVKIIVLKLSWWKPSVSSYYGHLSDANNSLKLCF